MADKKPRRVASIAPTKPRSKPPKRRVGKGPDKYKRDKGGRFA